MTDPNELISLRLRNQKLSGDGRTAAAVVAWLGAVQSQDYPCAKWALGLRASGLTEADVDRAFDRGTILRTHVMRPTWHFVTPADIRWLLTLTAPRVSAAMRSYNRRLELDGPLFARSNGVIERALATGGYLTRAELSAALARAGIQATGQRLAHIVLQAELDQVVCSGPRRGTQFTYALLAERAPGAKVLDREEARAELARRFFRSHGPATIRDFAWWSGMTAGDARLAVQLAGRVLSQAAVGARTYWFAAAKPTAARASDDDTKTRRRGDLKRTPAPDCPACLLPMYDEYLVAYQDRDIVVSAAAREHAGADPFAYPLVLQGRLAGRWRRSVKNGSLTVSVSPARRLTRAEAGTIEADAERLGRFAGLGSSVTIGV